MEVELPEPARQRLLTVAADLLGRLPGDAVPQSLRAIARFTPTKRRRLGAAAVAAAISEDDGFRDKLVELLRDERPELVEAVERTDADGVKDPLDVISAACLARPEGWEELVAAAVRRWESAQPAGPDASEIERLRAELARLRGAARAESARVRDAVTAAVADAEERVTAGRREIRERTRQVKEAVRERDELRAERDALRRRLEAERSGHEAELRRLRVRVADLERAIELGRRETRVERDLDDARLYLLTETLVQAANGLRRELSLSPPSVSPADAVAASAAPPGDTERRLVRDASALDRVLALPNVHLIVDGYNVTLTGYAGQTLADQRARLIGALAGLAARCSAEVTVAFDGATRPAVQPTTPRGVRVLFSQGEIADDLIRRLVAAEPPGRPLVVVTSDQQIVADVTRAGAYSAPSSVLLALLG